MPLTFPYAVDAALSAACTREGMGFQGGAYRRCYCKPQAGRLLLFSLGVGHTGRHASHGNPRSHLRPHTLLPTLLTSAPSPDAALLCTAITLSPRAGCVGLLHLMIAYIPCRMLDSLRFGVERRRRCRNQRLLSLAAVVMLPALVADDHTHCRRVTCGYPVHRHHSASQQRFAHAGRCDTKVSFKGIERRQYVRV